MAKRIISSPFLKKIGFSMSFICAIHCVATPFVIFLFPAVLAELFNNVYIEISLLLLSFIALFFRLLYDFNLHKNIFPVIVSGTGLLVMILVHVIEIPITHATSGFIGGLLILSGLFINWRILEANKICSVN